MTVAAGKSDVTTATTVSSPACTAARYHTADRALVIPLAPLNTRDRALGQPRFPDSTATAEVTISAAACMNSSGHSLPADQVCAKAAGEESPSLLRRRAQARNPRLSRLALPSRSRCWPRPRRQWRGTRARPRPTPCPRLLAQGYPRDDRHAGADRADNGPASRNGARRNPATKNSAPAPEPMPEIAPHSMAAPEIPS